MAVLSLSEYDQSYFDGNSVETEHPAGYDHYRRYPRISNDFVSHADSTGEWFADIGKYYNVGGFLAGKKVLELGCAKGYTLAYLRSIGITAWGIEASAYAVSQADPAVQPYITVGDALDLLAPMPRNDYNVIYSRYFLCCLDDARLTSLIALMNKVGFLQIHHIWTLCNPDYYNIKTIEQALALPFKKGTRLILNDDTLNPYTV